MSTSILPFSVNSPFIQCGKEEYNEETNSETHYPLHTNFGVVNMTMPETPLRNDKEFHILFTLDRSGSMCYELENVKKTLYNILNYLNEIETTIYVSIIYFNGSTHEIIRNKKLTSDTIQDIKTSSELIRADGVTNMEKVFNQTKEILHTTAENIHIFMTDGSPTSGSYCYKELSEYLDSTYEHYFLGFGTDHKAELLYNLSNLKTGSYYFIDNPENSALIYGEILSKFLYRKYHITLSSETLQFYNYRNNTWLHTYDFGNIGSEDKVDIHYIFDWDTEPSSLEYTIKYTDISTGVTKDIIQYLNTETRIYNLETITTPNERLLDVEKFYYRQKVLETMYQGVTSRHYTQDISNRVVTLFNKLNCFCETHNLTEDPFMKQLKDDLAIVHNTTYTGGNVFDSPFYLARHVSQGSQQAYNVSNITPQRNTLGTPPSMPRLRRRPHSYARLVQQSQYSFSNDLDDPCIDDNSTMDMNPQLQEGTPITQHTISRRSTNVYATPHRRRVMGSVSQDMSGLS